MIITIALTETTDGTIKGNGGWAETDGHRYPVKWEIGSDHPLPDGITFEQLRAAARDDRCLLVDDDDHWTLEEATP